MMRVPSAGLLSSPAQIPPGEHEQPDGDFVASFEFADRLGISEVASVRLLWRLPRSVVGIAGWLVDGGASLRSCRCSLLLTGGENNNKLSGYIRALCLISGSFSGKVINLAISLQSRNTMSGGGARSSQSHEAELASNTSARRMGEDVEAVKAKLIDREFNIKKYPDPLKPREQANQYPQDISEEDERRWLGMIEAAKKPENSK